MILCTWLTCGARYESIKTETVPAAKQSGQLGCMYIPSRLPEPEAHVSSAGPHTTEGAPPSQDRGEKTAENIRYGQNISESGMGGKTNSTGSASDGGYGSAARDKEQETSDVNARTSQGYGPGSGVGG